MTRLDIFGMTDVGLKRPNNEDAFVTDSERGFASVADGMGGAAAGEVASRIFVETAAEILAAGPASEEEAAGRVRNAFLQANERILDWARKDPQCRGMGCTAEIAFISGSRYIIGHVGDSRTYLFRHGSLVQLTRDHSFVQEQVDQGLISPADARHHARKNIILRSVGEETPPTVDLLQGDVMPGDCFLLCSDGLTDMVEDEAIRSILSSGHDIQQRAAALISAARDAGGKDNITAVLCEASA